MSTTHGSPLTPGDTPASCLHEEKAWQKHPTAWQSVQPLWQDKEDWGWNRNIDCLAGRKRLFWLDWRGMFIFIYFKCIFKFWLYWLLLLLAYSSALLVKTCGGFKHNTGGREVLADIGSKLLSPPASFVVLLLHCMLCCPSHTVGTVRSHCCFNEEVLFFLFYCPHDNDESALIALFQYYRLVT